MTHGSLFSGIGGFDLAAEWIGWQNVFHCEWNEFSQKILHYYWPQAEQFTDITKTNFTKYANKIDILTGGFPCQPYSSAGKRKGKADERHLWPHMLRAIREIQPTWVVGENVRGLVNWSKGLVFEEVQIDLEAAGYEVTPFLLPACSVNAPHRRDRVWFIAHSVSKRKRTKEYRSIQQKNAKIDKKGTQTFYDEFKPNGNVKNATNTNSNGQQWSDGKNEINTNQRRINALNDIEQNDIEHTKSKRLQNTLQDKKLERQRFRQSNKRITWDAFPSVPPICVGNDGFSSKLDGITFPKWRNESIKAAGNAIVPQVAYQIFKAIEQYNNLKPSKL